MAEKVKVEPDAALSRAAAIGGIAHWRQNSQKTRAAVPEKSPWGAPPATPKLDRTFDVLKGCGLVFDSSDPRPDRFMRAKRKIGKYIGKYYTNRGDAWWTLEQEKLKTIFLPENLDTSATDIKKNIFKVKVSKYVNSLNRLNANPKYNFALISRNCIDLTCMQL